MPNFRQKPIASPNEDGCAELLGNCMFEIADDGTEINRLTDVPSIAEIQTLPESSLVVLQNAEDHDQALDQAFKDAEDTLYISSPWVTNYFMRYDNERIQKDVKGYLEAKGTRNLNSCQ